MRRRFVPFLLLFVLWIYFLVLAGSHEIQVRHGPNGVLLGSDFAMFYSASVVLRNGGNPYDHVQLFRAEAALMRRDHRALFKPKQRGLVRVGNPPLFFWLIGPLTTLPFAGAAYGWMAAMWALAALGFLFTARALDYRGKSVAPAIIFVLMPQVVDATVFGNPIAVVFAGFSLALLLLRRAPVVAGILMSLAWLKPQVAIPIAVLLILFQAPAPWRVAGGAIVGSVVQFFATMLTTGWASLLEWFHGLTGYTSTIAVQLDLTSLVGIYFKWAPAELRTVLEGVTLVLATAVSAWWWWRYRERVAPGRFTWRVPMITTAWLWAMWFLATPYAHFEDQMLLAAPVLALFTRQSPTTFKLSMTVLYLLFLSLVPEVVTLKQVQLLWAPLLGVMVCMVLAARSSARAVDRDTAAPERLVPAMVSQAATSGGRGGTGSPV